MAGVSEQSWVLVGKQVGPQAWQVRRRRPMRGEPKQVQADWAWALEREEQQGDVAGFWHTHPLRPADGQESSTRPSERDERTLKAWCSAFGKPLLCLISCGRRVDGWVYTPQGGRLLRRVEKAGRGVWLVEA